MKKNSTKKWEEMPWKYTTNWMQEKSNDFGLKYGKPKA